ncbi:methylmalonyl-CoA epimerase [Hyphomonas sp.]|jgi:methylmalonyl-CoA/ethylmalonyl-CoA epimerase|uniref:methylmalonyl-CoA epimerase n=1 Tax=Hyphomonas sp. TaxID=87 RepID=UPI0037BF0C17
MSDFKIGPLNHVGVAVPNIEQACDIYRTLYGATDITTPFDMPEQGVRVCFVNLPNSQIELIEPLNDASPIANFIKKNPSGGQHHVCFEVADINQAVTEMEKRGATVLGKPRIGAHGTMIIFVHPRNSNGVLVELMETPKGHH